MKLPGSLGSNVKGSSFGVILLSIAVIIVAILIFLNAADYALYSLKRNMVARGMDYSVSAAVQEIDMAKSDQGLAGEFDENTGVPSTDNIFINETSANNAFFSTLRANSGLIGNQIGENTLCIIINPVKTELEYIIDKGYMHFEGAVAGPEEIEGLINGKIEELWPDLQESEKKTFIYVNGNIKTNEFKKRPYYIAVIKDLEIDGLFRKRTATFVGFTGAKIERAAK